MLNCQMSMRGGLKKKSDFSGLSVKGREAATAHQNTGECASCRITGVQGPGFAKIWWKISH